MKILNYLLPNFFSGKKLKAQHLQELVQHLQAWASDLSRLGNSIDHYGLVYDQTLSNQSLLLHGKILEVHDLAAISPSGTPIVVKRGVSPALYLQLPDHPSQEKLEVYIVANNKYAPPSKKDPFATYSYPSYRLALYPLEHTDEFQHCDAVKIGQVDFKKQNYQLNQQITPAIHLKANNQLWSSFLKLKGDWGDFHQYNQRINYLNQTRENSDRQSLFRMTEAIDTYLAGVSCQFNGLNEKSHPKELFYLIAGLANIMHSKLSTMYRKSQLLDLMAKFSDTQGYQFLHTGFEDGIDFSQEKYQHDQLDDSIKRLQYFFDIVKIVWMRLANATDHVPQNQPLTNSL